MNDDLIFDYMMQMGAMQPEQQELKRKQAMLDALRKNASVSPEGQMIGKHYVAPHWSQQLSRLGDTFVAMKGMQGVDAQMRDMNARQAKALEELRRRRMQPGMAPAAPASYDPYSNLLAPSDEA